MTQFVITDKAPEELKKNEIVIEMPSFMAEIEQESDKSPRNKLTAVNHLRAIAGTVGRAYDEQFNPWSHIKPNKFVGRRFNDNEELSRIVVEMFEKQYPNIFGSYIANQIKVRPKNTELIHFVGPENFAQLFFNDGIDQKKGKE